MADLLLRMLLWSTSGLVLVLLLRRPARRWFGAGAAFTLWLLPVVLMLAPLLPQAVRPSVAWALPVLVVAPYAEATARTVLAPGWTNWMVALWVAGVLAGGLRLLLQYLRLRRGLRRVPAAWRGWLAHSVRGLDPRRVRVHPAGPAVLWALPRPLILLPPDFPARFGDTAKRGLVLRHELTHARRGDALWSLAMELVLAVLWFHPLAWYARSRFRLDQELACDAVALRSQPDCTASYARALLESVAVDPVPALIPWLAEPQLKERIVMIASTQPGALRRHAGFIAVAALLAGGLFIAGGQTPLVAATHGAVASTTPAVDASYREAHRPAYPVGALKKGEQGTVMLDVTVNKHGDVVGVRVDARRTHSATVLQDAAVAAAENWKFNPGTRDGHPVGGVVTVPVTFSLSPTSPGAGKPGCPQGFQYRQGAHGSFSCSAKSARIEHVDGQQAFAPGGR